MMWLIFNTKAEAYEYSHMAAIEHNRGRSTDTIQYWWLVRKTANGKWAVQCPDGNQEPIFEEVTL